MVLTTRVSRVKYLMSNVSCTFRQAGHRAAHIMQKHTASQYKAHIDITAEPLGATLHRANCNCLSAAGPQQQRAHSFSFVRIFSMLLTDRDMMQLTSYTSVGVRLLPVLCGMAGVTGASLSRSTGEPGLNRRKSASERDERRLSLVTVSGRGPTAIAKWSHKSSFFLTRFVPSSCQVPSCNSTRGQSTVGMEGSVLRRWMHPATVAGGLDGRRDARSTCGMK